MSTAARGASAPASAPAARAAPRRASATSPRRSAVPARPRVASPAARLGRRAGAVTAISSADAEIPEPEARDDAATDAAAAESNLNDLQAQLAALMSSNQALQQDLEKARPPEPEPEPAASTSAPAVPFGAPATAAPVIERRVLAPGELLNPATDATIRWPHPGENPPFWEREPYPAPLPSEDDARGVACENPLHVVHITAEMAPIAKVGGLGDVVTGLARANMCQGHDVEVILPYYSSIEGKIDNFAHVMDFDVPKGSETEWDGVRETRIDMVSTSMFTGTIGGCNVILLRPAAKERMNLFVGGRIYGGSYNELEAYLYFCRASLECLRATGRDPNVIHVHEWQCSAVAMLYWDLYHAQGMLRNAKVMLTIHNMDNTGECRQEEFIATGLNGEDFNTLEKAMDERTIGHNPERMCLLKGAIVYSNFVTTVSPTYAREALGGGGGFLAKTLQKKRQHFAGVLNGVDEDIWDARVDPIIPASFKPGAMQGKALCKKYVQMGLGMDVNPDKPLVVCISRLVPQKGIELIKHAIPHTKDQGGQFVLLGSGHSDPPFSAMAESVYKNDQDVKLLIFYSDPLSHLLYAAADIVLVPSMFEPCGLTQMIAMEYGALPLVRKTGGLADTVHDLDDYAVPEEKRNGFVFEGADTGDLERCMTRAFDKFKHQRDFWRATQEKVMTEDNTWDTAGQEYVRLYRAMQMT